MEMKKIICVVFLSFVFYGPYEYVNMKKYQSETKSIEIKGLIKNPGVYEVPYHASVDEIIRKAGGVLANADTRYLNMGKDIENRAVIVIDALEKEEKISLNSASLEELDTLKGIGPTIAQRIIDYRSLQSFQVLEDLKKVKGIGDKLFDSVEDQVIL